MAKNIYVIVVHGIGKPAFGYAAPLVKGLRDQLNRIVQAQLASADHFQ